MFKNYLYLNRLIVETAPVLINKTIYEAFTQEKDRLYLDLGDEKHIIISTDQNLPYLTISDGHKKAKKNTISFFGELLPDVIEGVFIAEYDRIILLKMKKSSIYFFIRGNITNVFATDPFDNLHSFKKVNEKEAEKVKSILKEKSFINDFINPDLSGVSSIPEIKKQFPFLSKQILDVISGRTFDRSFAEIFPDFLNEFFHSEIAVGFIQNEIIFFPEDWISGDISTEISFFNNYIDGLNNYLKVFHKSGRISDVKSVLTKYVDNELSRVSSKLNNLKTRIEKGSREEQYKHYGNLLLANREVISKGMNSIETEDYITGEKIKIRIDDKKSPQQNIDYYFEKSRDERQNYEISKELFDAAHARFEKLKLIDEKIRNTEDVKILEEIAKELKIRNKPGKMENRPEEKIRFKQYLIEGKYHLFVGKDSESNDRLSVKFAKQNDYWFHARSVPGSHVVLRNDNKKEVIPKNVIKSAAAIAAFHSKAKTSSLAPVTYTFAKFVVKKKGMPPGQVQLLKENVILVRPEIPANCEFVED